MGTYTTLDYLSAYKPTASEMASARLLTFTPAPAEMLASGYENEALYYESGDNALLRSLFKINLTEGAKYYIYSSSFFDPFILSLHDMYGSFIAVDTDSGYGRDTIWYTAPYTGVYYVDASWDQGEASGHKFVYLSVDEDIIPTPPKDITAPTVSIFMPHDESTGIPISQDIVMIFSEAIQRGSGLILIKDGAGAVVATYDASSSVNLSINGTVLTIDPTADLAYGTGYKVEVPKGSITDLAGNLYGGTSNYNFGTIGAPDTTAPIISIFKPGDEATGVGISESIVVTFSEAILRGSGSILLKDASGAIVATFDAASSQNITLDGRVLTIDPSADFNYSTTYLVDFGSGALTDLAGNVYSKPPSYNFTTIAPPNHLPTGTVSIDGESVQDQTLVANTKTVGDLDGLGSFSYQWLRSGTAIAGATGETYKLDATDVSSKISIRVQFTDGHGVSEIITSGATAAVLSSSSTNGNDSIRGTDGPDSINGLSGSDVISGGLGNDLLDGGPGFDVIDGGAGIDSAIYPGVRTDYLLSRNSSGAVTVADKFGVMDTLKDVENLQIGSELVATVGLPYQPDVTMQLDGVSNLVYRFYNTRDRAYFYSSVPAERELVVRESTDSIFTPANGVWPYFYQGSTFEQAHSSPGALPVYRFYNTITGHHFFTISESEKALVLRESTDSLYTPENGLWPFNYEGIGFVAYPASNHIDALPVYRFYSPNLNRHFFTADLDEVQQIKLTGLWNDEGIAFYGETPG